VAAIPPSSSPHRLCCHSSLAAQNSASALKLPLRTHCCLPPQRSPASASSKQLTGWSKASSKARSAGTAILILGIQSRRSSHCNREAPSSLKMTSLSTTAVHPNVIPVPSRPQMIPKALRAAPSALRLHLRVHAQSLSSCHVAGPAGGALARKLPQGRQATGSFPRHRLVARSWKQSPEALRRLMHRVSA